MKTKRLKIGKYTVALYEQQTQIEPDPGLTRIEVIAGERPPHWIVRLIRGGYTWDIPDYQSVIPMTNQEALEVMESVLLRHIRENGEYIETAIYMLAGMPH